jgi:hypothetical protein
MAERVYIETTVVSYLTARPSRDLIVAGHQQITHDWCDQCASKGFKAPIICTPEDMMEVKP